MSCDRHRHGEECATRTQSLLSFPLVCGTVYVLFTSDFIVSVAVTRFRCVGVVELEGWGVASATAALSF